MKPNLISTCTWQDKFCQKKPNENKSKHDTQHNLKSQFSPINQFIFWLFLTEKQNNLILFSIRLKNWKTHTRQQNWEFLKLIEKILMHCTCSLIGHFLHSL